jgi:signal transduction histidine kinase
MAGAHLCSRNEKLLETVTLQRHLRSPSYKPPIRRLLFFNRDIICRTIGVIIILCIEPLVIQRLDAEKVEVVAMTTSVNRKKPLEPLENQLQDRERLRALAQLAESVSHAMHNPLTSIFLHADILEEELRRPQAENSQQSLDSLRLIREEVTRVRDLVEQYLLLIRLPMLPRQPEDLGVFLESFVFERRERLAACSIALRLEGSPDVGPVAMHQKAFDRALLIVLEHGVAAMPDGGSITLRAQRTGSGVQLAISHTGEGIPPEQLSELMSAAQCSKPGRMGLGLYLAKEIVVAHGGTFEVTSQPDMGTTYTATLPPLGS